MNADILQGQIIDRLQVPDRAPGGAGRRFVLVSTPAGTGANSGRQDEAPRRTVEGTAAALRLRKLRMFAWSSKQISC